MKISNEYISTEEEMNEKEEKKASNTEKSASKKEEKDKEQLNSKNPIERLKARYQLKKTRAIIGGIFLVIGIFLTLSTFSYFFTWQEDQSSVINNGFWHYIFSEPDVQPENWIGKFGAWFSHLLMYRWVGISSLCIPFLFILLGIFHAFGYKSSRFPLKKTTIIGLFFMFWSSVFFGYFVAHINYLGGTFGYYSNQWLNETVGKIGNFFVQLLILYIGLVVLFNFSFKKAKEKWNGLRSQDGSLDDEMPLEPDTTDDIYVINPIKEKDIKAEAISNTINFDEEENEEAEASNDKDGNTSEDSITRPTIDNDGDDFEIEVAQPAEREVADSEINKLRQEYGDYDPTLDLSGYTLPSIDLLRDYGSSAVNIDKKELEENKDKIVETLGNYKIDISKIKATVGPTVTLYEIIPAPGVRISKIKNLEDDIALSLAALGIRIIAPIPGKGTIGIEVPNKKREMVSMRSLIASEKFQNSDYELPVVIGRTITNETFTFDLTKMPHLLVAGATGQGKSVGLNAILVSILYKKHPSQVKFILVDPKKVELTLYNKIEKHFLAKLPDSDEAIITDTTKVINTLNSLCIEMDERYDLLKEAQVRTIKEYNVKFVERRLNPEKGHRYLPYIIVLIDEFADLIMTAGREVETPIARLAQLARAIGIHLIVATQRPSVNVITGMIKANFPSRIAFRVQSKIDSRTILDGNGADQLIGMGDMLISTGSDLVRLQCGFVDTDEVEAICEFIGSQRSYPEAMLLPEYVSDNDGSDVEFSSDEIDPMFADGARLVVISQQGSASLLQRKLKLGYNRAGRIIDQLEAFGVVGPHQGSKAREVLFDDVEQLNEFLKTKGIEG